MEREEYCIAISELGISWEGNGRAVCVVFKGWWEKQENGLWQGFNFSGEINMSNRSISF